MKNIFILISLIVCLQTSSQISIKGRWISQSDPKSVVIITDSKFIELYGRDTTYSAEYWRSSKSCDSSYYNGNKKLDFLRIKDGRCFEITGVSKTQMSFRYTMNGKLHLFRRVIAKR